MDSYFSRTFRGAVVICLLGLLVVSAGTAEAQYFGRNKIQYENFDWYVLNTPHFEIFYYPEEEELAARAAVLAEDAYARLSRTFDHELETQVPFILYASPNDFQQTNIADGLIGEGTGGFSEPIRNRMVLPYPGDSEGFVHVINHELVHVFMFDVAYKSYSAKSARRRWFPVPLWFAEGMAEWFSSEWDNQADMWLRDATIYDWLIPLHQIYGGYQVYKEGQAAMRYIATTYGEEKVVDLFKALGRTPNVDRALQQTIGLDTEALSKEWEKSLKQEYWPLYADKPEPDEIGRRMTDHWEKQAYFFQQPSLSPDGRFIAFFSDFEGLVDLFLMDTIEGKVVKKLVTGYRSNRFLTLHSFDSSIGFSPDSERVVFVAKSGQDEHLFVVDIESSDVVHEIPLGMDIARSPSFSPSGERVVLNGTRGGKTDLFEVDIASGSVRQLTDDFIDEHSPSWFPDGKRILFSAHPAVTDEVSFDRDERGVMRLEPTELSPTKAKLSTQSYDLIAIDIATGERETIVSTQGADRDPVVFDDETIVFVSDVNGVSNLYVHSIATGESRRVTDVLGGIFHPSVSPATDQLAFTAFTKAGFDIFLVEDFRKLSANMKFAAEDQGELELALGDREAEVPTLQGKQSTLGSKALARFAVAERQHELGTRVLNQPALFEMDDSTPTLSFTQADPDPESDPEADPEAEVDPSESDAPEDPSPFRDVLDLTEAEDEDAALPPGMRDGRTIGRIEKYKLRFSLDPIGSGYGGVFYSSNSGLGLANLISMSDLLGNHRMQFLVNFYGSLKNSDLAASYYYLKRRVNLAGGVFHYRNFINSNFTSLGEVYERNRLFSERNYGVFGLASYPFSQFSRVDLELQAFISERTFYDFDAFSGFFFETAEESSRLVQPSLSYVHDSSFWAQSGPISGSRWLVSVSPSIPISDSDVERTTSFVDLRKYGRLWGRNSVALRLIGAVSNGPNPRSFVVGGPWTLRGYDLYDFESRDLAGNPTNPFLLGRKMMMANFEYRMPVVDALIFGWPARWGIGGISGAAFFDVGAAYDDKIKLTDRNSAGELILQDLNADLGFGIRMNIGWLPLKFDWAWKTDLAEIGDEVQYHFSIGPQF